MGHRLCPLIVRLFWSTSTGGGTLRPAGAVKVTLRSFSNSPLPFLKQSADANDCNEDPVCQILFDFDVNPWV